MQYFTIESWVSGTDCWQESEYDRNGLESSFQSIYHYADFNLFTAKIYFHLYTPTREYSGMALNR